MWKWLLGISLFLIAGCVGTGYWAYSSGKLKPIIERFNPESKATAVRLEPVTRGTLIRSVSAPGLLEPRTKVQISAQVAARIMAIPIRENQIVRKGDVVVRLDATEFAALVDGAKANVRIEQARLQNAQATLANSIVELGRKRELYSSKDISKAELDAAQLQYAQAEAQLKTVQSSIENAQANVDRVEKDLSNCVIAAPFDGVITKRNAEVGELVLVGTLNNASSVIMEIADLSDMLVKARIDEANIAPVKAGQKAKVFLNPFPDKAFPAVVERVSLVRQLDRDNSAYFEAELKLENPDQMELREGFTANAEIAVETFEDVLLVPSQAVVDRVTEELPKDVLASAPNIDKAKKFSRVVYLFKDGKAVVRPVTIGASDLTRTMIVGGLDTEERVVAGPFKVLLAIKHDQNLTDEATLPAKESGGQRIDSQPKAEGKAESKADAKPEPKPESKPHSKPESQPDSKANAPAANTDPSGPASAPPPKR